MNIELTKESRKVLKSIYDLYRDRRKDGTSKSAATHFESGLDIDGLSDAQSELSKAGLIKCDIIGGFELQDSAIIFMENFTKESVLKWLDFGSKLIP